MLRELSIKNFAIIDEVNIRFQNGLTVLTGETGAGKSIIIDAVHLITGGRGSAEYIRHGAKRAELEGLFEVEKVNEQLSDRLNEYGIDFEDHFLIFRREIQENGKSICRINGKLVTITMLREIGGLLIDIHGQHETQELMNEQHHLALLDHFSSDIGEKKKDYDQLFEQYRLLKSKIEKFQSNEKEIAHRIDLYQFQIQEIDAVQLKENEEDDLLEDRKRLSNFHKIYERLARAYEAMQGEQKGIDFIGQSVSEINDATLYDDALQELSETASSTFYALQDVSFQLKNYMDELEYDDNRLNEVEDRLATIQGLKRKYGASVKEVFDYREKISEELDQLIHRDERSQRDFENLAHLENELIELANELSKLRKSAAEQLSAAIMTQLQDLYMEKATFHVQFSPLDKPTRDGMDDVAFYISTNVGEPPKPLVKIASGGELSRMMLALKSIFSVHQGITSIIFDEVDTGVSGRVAQAIAEKIEMISRGSQVLCITHLPQVAAMADHHVFIEKEIVDDRTKTKIVEMSGEKRVDELSRMMSGKEITSTTKQHAKELLQLAEDRKRV